MTRYVVDTSAALHLAATEAEISEGAELLAPTLLRSQMLSKLHELVARGELSDEEGKERLAWLVQTKIRLLGDAVLRQVAWRLADQLGWESTYDAEYLALTQLQADAFVTLDPDLARQAAQVVPVAAIDDLVDSAPT